MGVLEVACGCGHRMRVPESAFGTSVACPSCGGGLYVSLSSVVKSGTLAPEPAPPRAERLESAAAVQAARAVESVLAERCARCNREFRGDWDRHTTPEGIVCNICARRAEPVIFSAEPPHAPAQPAVKPSGDRRMMMPEYTQISRYIVDEPARKPARDRTKMKRDAIILGAAFLLTMGIIAFFPVETFLSRTDWEPRGELSRGWGIVVMIVRIIAMFAGSYIAFYIVLNKANKLPNETFIGNLLVLGPPVVGLAVMAMLPVPAPFAAALLTLYLCFFVYDLSFSEFVELLIFGMLAGVLVGALTPLIYFMIAAIAL